VSIKEISVPRNWRVFLIIAASLLGGARAGTPGPGLAGGFDRGFSSTQPADPAPQKSIGSPKGTPSSKERRIAVAEDYVRHAVLLMDTDGNGKVSKQEFMAFMETEFERLDLNHDGELDVKKLAKYRVRPYTGK
jgi:EF hand